MDIDNLDFEFENHDFDFENLDFDLEIIDFEIKFKKSQGLDREKSLKMKLES